MIQYIDGKRLREMFISGANNLQNNKDLVDKLNVFPVPDGDTGTNMSLTISYALKELAKVENDNISDIGKALSKGSLMGARGNSGVILSQIIRGIAKSIEGKSKLSTEDLAKAFKNGSDTAYKAVIKPIEGTILTVVRECGEFAIKTAKKEKDVVKFLSMLVKESNSSLERTPDLLKNLKEAGVVDSGGKGLVLIYEGMLAAIKGDNIEIKNADLDTNISTSMDFAKSTTSTDDIKYCYCTEFILESSKVEDTKIRDIMMAYGDSLAVVGDDGVIKVHVHTNDPGNVLQEALKYGQLLTIKIENMKLQHENTLLDVEEKKENDSEPLEEEKEFGFIATSMGEGLANIFKDFGVDHIIEGGQTMNPSTEDFMNAIRDINAKNIFIFPNNSNIIMAANQAKELSDKNIIVIPTKNTPQGFAALVTFNGELSEDENKEAMMNALNSVKSGQVTFAVRDTVMNEIDVKEGNIIGIAEGNLLSAGDYVDEVTSNLIEKLVDEDTAIITLFFGEDVTESQANELRTSLEEKFEDVDVELYYGGQPLYYYLISVE
ncbi:DAK2 domain-containing protein [Clostridioides difficile]|uniref:DAK2 domain-containing protein n=1 Tax=Clostridioides difficile TaxID=1496 RepID=UPI001C194010|nr:DAK2 domain-containing protein [Clostridioides difficile]MCJ0055106.1 DAK2 domain-containing protein [Clostridioides difficile]MCU5872984.1 DAK2 domain-containing protein [Clostridioides difficile]MCU5899306.1 DAK2 domain-containing protein [Clostridioides difficile]HBF6218532.1 DAK2 domain-containing protein [Clostridioides difficile]HBF6481126.1 DAK2 domain-containing protein [Clostridioides difficile]